MFKNVIAPIQAWLLSQGKCVGCSTPLSKGETKEHGKGIMVTCKRCRRIFIQDTKTKQYRRALLSEV